MSKRQRSWANRAKADLFQRMGNVCWKCGCVENLQFDHPMGRDWSVRKTEFSWRVSRYRQEWARGEGQLLCETDNGNRPTYTRYAPPPGVIVPSLDEPVAVTHGASELEPF